MKRFLGTRGAFWSVAVALIGAGIAAHHLFWHTGPLGADSGNYRHWYVPSAMLVCGYGFTNPLPSSNDALARFFLGSDISLETASLHGLRTEGILFPDQRRHRYLLLAVAAVWRLFGVSWQSIKYLQVLALVLSAFLLHCILRRLVPACLSLLGCIAFMTTPGVLRTLECIRDFWKVPFFLATVLFLTRLITGPPLQKRTYRMLAATMGGVIGIGIGFRQDMTVCLPPILLGLLFCPLQSSAGRLVRARNRAVAIVLSLSTFLLVGLPIVVAELQTGTRSADQVVAGLADAWARPLGVENGSYNVLYTTTDSAYMVMRTSYARRVCHMEGLVDSGSPTSERMALHFLWGAACTFPADFLVRGYAAVLWVLRGCPAPVDIPPGACDPFLAACGLYVGIAALAGISCCGPGRAAALLLSLLYFGAYPSLEFAYRHAFHLVFVPILLIASVLSLAVRAWHTAREACRQAPRGAKLRALIVSCGLGMRRVAIWVPVLLFILLGPLAVARSVQYFQVGRLMDKCASAPAIPIETRTTVIDRTVLFRVKEPGPFLPIAMTGCNFTTRYLMAAITGKVKRIGLNYDADPAGDNLLSSDVAINVPGASDTEPVRYFFPVYEFCPSAFSPWVRFSGISLALEDGAEFHGLYEVSNLDGFGVLPCLALPQESSHASRFLRLPPLTGAINLKEIGHPLTYFSRELMAKAFSLKSQGDIGGLIHIYQEGLASDPGNVMFREGLAAAYRAKNPLSAELWRVTEQNLTPMPALPPVP